MPRTARPSSRRASTPCSTSRTRRAMAPPAGADPPVTAGARRRTTLTAVTMAGLLAVGACGSSDDGHTSTTTAITDPTSLTLQQALATTADELEVGGAAVTVIGPDGEAETAVTGTIGLDDALVSPSTRFPIASITKVFTAATALRAEEQGA